MTWNCSVHASTSKYSSVRTWGLCIPCLLSLGRSKRPKMQIKDTQKAQGTILGKWKNNVSIRLCRNYAIKRAIRTWILHIQTNHNSEYHSWSQKPLRNMHAILIIAVEKQRCSKWHKARRFQELESKGFNLPDYSTEQALQPKLFRSWGPERCTMSALRVKALGV